MHLCDIAPNKLFFFLIFHVNTPPAVEKPMLIKIYALKIITNFLVELFIS